MRVISTIDVDSWVQAVTCNNCKSRLEVNISDLTKIVDPRDGNYAECFCPVCKDKVTFAQNLLPPAVWANLGMD